MRLIHALLVVAATAGTTPSTSAATAVVRAFYSWCWHQGPGTASNLAPAGKFFDPQFFAMIVRGCPSDPLDWDPFLAGNAGWQSYALGSPAVKGTLVLVPVRIRLPYSDHFSHLTAVVQQEASRGYAIDDFIYDDIAHKRLRAILGACKKSG